MKNILTIISLLLTTVVFGQLNMDLLSNWHGATVRYNDVWGYVDDFGGEYAILGSRTDTYFINLSDPTNPIEIASFTGDYTDGTTTIAGNNTTWRDFKTFGRYAYGVCDGCTEGLQVFDLSKIHFGIVTKVNQTTSTFTSCHNIYIDVANGRMYAVGGTMGSKVAVFDVAANPVNPLLLANVVVDGGYIHDIFVQNNIAYCSSGYDGMYIIDFTNPTTPVTKAFLDTGGYNHSSWIYEDGTKLLYAEEVPQGLPMGILDITNAANNDITIINTFNAPLEAPVATNVTYHNPYIVDDYAIVASYNDGITVFNIADPQNPILEAHYDSYPDNMGVYDGYNGVWGTYPYLPSGTILSSDRETGLYVLQPTSISLTTDCYNGVADVFEENIDCGGFCKPCATCDDGIKNGDEEGIDCGGDTCVPCPCDGSIVRTGTESIASYHSSDILTSDATIPSETTVYYNANEIELFPSFEVQINSIFEANISPCTNPGSLTEKETKAIEVKE